eukprot:295663-Pyramimonas_sp.AAC.1
MCETELLVWVNIWSRISSGPRPPAAAGTSPPTTPGPSSLDSSSGSEDGAASPPGGGGGIGSPGPLSLNGEAVCEPRRAPCPAEPAEATGRDDCVFDI